MQDRNAAGAFSLGLAVVALIVSVLVALLVCSKARADIFIDTPEGRYVIGTFTPFGPAKIINVNPPSGEEADARTARWIRDCKITFYMDDHTGVRHYNFSRSPRGCEFGYLPGEVK